ncbi:Pentatricopeptide repeat-containing protein [Acorus gramineus]|uniref:Pentatricopeptide repeat-containing protein n=1 Tax=Acorus gramineus TaxID=55184 RepID=A0AAV9BRJ7_ACOGR|nr:Pentatricopeptide repeat-containing protein [Acorus gramineus]
MVPSVRTLLRLLRSPSTTTNQVKQIHAHLLLFHHPSLFQSSLNLFNSLIFAYASSRQPHLSFLLFATQTSLLPPNHLTFQFLLKASSKSKSLLQSSQIHCISTKLGFGSHVFVQNGLLHCYVTCGRLKDARRMFDVMPERDVASFNCMIHGYAESGDMDSASCVFRLAPSPNVVTWTAMVSGYARKGDVHIARRVFEEMPHRDVVSWNAMMSAYVQNRHPVAALGLFRRMQLENLGPSLTTIVGLLLACTGARALDQGKWVHAYLNKKRILLNSYLGSALIDMYCKCGAVELGFQVFTGLVEKNLGVWNAMINGLAINGYSERALELFDEMRMSTTVLPDEVTFVGVLLACSHAGFVEEGRRHFHCTVKECGVRLVLEHYSCMVDLLARCGFLKEAEDIVRYMPIQPDDVVWRALLGGGLVHKDVELAERVVLEIDAHCSGDYVLLSNLYASVGRWNEVERVRRFMKDKRIEKTPGCSSVEIESDSRVHLKR